MTDNRTNAGLPGVAPGVEITRSAIIVGAVIYAVVMLLVVLVVLFEPNDNVLLAMLSNVPGPVDVVIWIVTALTFFVLVALPFILMIASEPTDYADWRKLQAAEVPKEASDGSSRKVRNVIYWIDSINRAVGQFAAWLGLIMVLTQFFVVIIRYVFAFGSIQMQESILYMHGMLFMFGAGYTLLHDGHVRVDMFYERFPKRRKAKVNAFGVLVFILPLAAYGWYLAFPFVMNAWRVMESSQEPLGLPFIFLLKTVILAFLILISIQAVAMLLRSFLIWRGQPTRQAIKDDAPHGMHET